MSWMRFFTSIVPGSSGVICRMIFHSGNWCIRISASGARTAPGIGCNGSYEKVCSKRQVVKQHRALREWTVRVAKERSAVGSTA